MSNSGRALIFDGTKGNHRYKPNTQKQIPILAATDEDANRKQEFRQILEEVQKLGALQLGWKERKELESKKLAALGAKSTKGIKVPISMELAIKRKREKVEAERTEQDILAGVLPTKRRKKTPLRENNEDKGLRLSEGKFKGGVLYVQKPERKAVRGEKHGRDRVLDRVFNEGGSKGAGKSKKGKGKKKGGNKERQKKTMINLV